MFVVHGTRKLLDRLTEATTAPPAPSTTALGDWYATVLFWKPRIALFVNESTLLPVLTPFAPSATLIDRFPAALETVLEGLGTSRTFIEHELAVPARCLAATPCGPLYRRHVSPDRELVAFAAQFRR